MYRLIAIVVGGLALAACSSNSQWLNLDALKPGPVMETVQFESTPPGAEVKLSNGQTCRTPCALAMPHPESGGYDATFTLNGYEPDTEQIQLTSMGNGSSELRPNPVIAELAPTPPPPKPKKIVRKKRVAKPAAKKPKAKPAAQAKPTAAAPTAPPAQQSPSPWPPVQPAPQQK
jgi:PEGA domain